MDFKAYSGQLSLRDIEQFQLPHVIPHAATGNNAEAPARLSAYVKDIAKPGCLLEAYDAFTARDGYLNYRVGAAIAVSDSSILALTQRKANVSLEVWPLTGKLDLVLWDGHPSGQASLLSAQGFLMSQAYPGLTSWATTAFRNRHGVCIVGQSGDVERGLLICNSRALTESAIIFAQGRLFSIVNSPGIFASTIGRAVSTAITEFNGATILRVTPSQAVEATLKEGINDWVPHLRVLTAACNAPRKRSDRDA